MSARTLQAISLLKPDKPQLNMKKTIKLNVGDQLTVKGTTFNISSPFLAKAFQRLVRHGKVRKAGRLTSDALLELQAHGRKPKGMTWKETGRVLRRASRAQTIGHRVMSRAAEHGFDRKGIPANEIIRGINECARKAGLNPLTPLACGY